MTLFFCIASLQTLRCTEYSPDMTIDPDIAHRALRKNTDKIVCEGGIDPFVLARKLDSAELITDDVYRQCTDRYNDWSDHDRVEHIIKQIRVDIQKDGDVFNDFLKVLRDAGHQPIVDILSSTYQGTLNNLVYFESTIYQVLVF